MSQKAIVLDPRRTPQPSPMFEGITRNRIHNL